MEAKEEGKAEKFFKEFGKRLDRFMVEAKEAGTRVEADLQKKYDELKAAADRKSTRLNSCHMSESRMPSSA